MGARLSGSLSADGKEEEKTHEESSHSHGRNTSHPYPAQQAVCSVAVKLRWSAIGAVPPNLQGGGNRARGCELHRPPLEARVEQEDGPQEAKDYSGRREPKASKEEPSLSPIYL